MGVRSAWAAACRREAVKNIVMAVGEEVVESSGSLVESVCVQGRISWIFSGRSASGISVVAGGREKGGLERRRESLRTKDGRKRYLKE